MFRMLWPGLPDATAPGTSISLGAATRDWPRSGVAKAVKRAYTKTRAYIVATPAIEIAKPEKSFFPSIELDVLAQCISSYQRLAAGLHMSRSHGRLSR